MKDLMKWEPKKELIIVAASLLWTWFSYYADRNLYGDNMMFVTVVSILLTMIGSCVILPVWWIAVHNQEGIAGLHITKERLVLTIIFMIALSAWRFLEIREFIGNPNLVSTLVFNALSIWEVVFIFGWLFTRFEKSFGKIPAVLLTMLSVGIYHIGSLKTENILRLCIVIGVCGICYLFTQNIFTFWPIYWTIGCSASTLRSGMAFPTSLIIMSAFVLLVQIAIIVVYQREYVRMLKKK